MPYGVPVPYATFIAEFPEFSEVKPAVVNAQLARAANWIDTAVWGIQANDGMKYLAAHWLMISPFGMNTRLKPGQTTTYWVQFEEMRLAVRGVALVAGGSQSLYGPTFGGPY